MLKLNLQLFAQDAQPAAQPSTGDVTGGADMAEGQAQGGADQQFQSMITGQFKDQYEAAVGQRVQQAIQQRFRNQRDMQKQMEAYNPIMQALGAKYGIDPGDVDGISKRLTDDDSLYAEEASKRGLPVSTYKTMVQLEQRNKALEAQRQQSVEERARQQHFQKLVQQAETLKQQFPDFDLMTEIEANPRFARMTAPGVGMSVQEAYFALHGSDIQRQSMQYAAQQAGKRIADSVRAGASRPMEGGMGNRQAAPMGVDVAHMDPKTREEYRRRIKSGELINFIDKI